jgi:hypothetical protein
VGARNGTLVCREFVRSYFPEPDDYADFVNDYESSKKSEEGLGPYLFDE